MKHVTLDIVDEFIPRVPKSRCAGEDDTIPRICAAPRIKGCISAMPLSGEIFWRMNQLGLPLVIHVYDLKSEHILENAEVSKLVPDACFTGEVWITEKPDRVIRRDYEIRDAVFENVTGDDGMILHRMTGYRLVRTKQTDNIQNLIETLGPAFGLDEDLKKQLYGLLSKHPFGKVILTFYTIFMRNMRPPQA